MHYATSPCVSVPLSRCSCPSTFPSAVITPRCKLHNPVTVGISCRFSNAWAPIIFFGLSSIDRCWPSSPSFPALWIPSFERSVLNLRGKWWDFAVYRLGNVCFREHTGNNGDTYLSIGLLIGWSVIFIVEYFYFEIRFVWKEIKKSLVFNLNGYTFQLKRDNQKIVKNSILCILACWCLSSMQIWLK